MIPRRSAAEPTGTGASASHDVRDAVAARAGDECRREHIVPEEQPLAQSGPGGQCRDHARGGRDDIDHPDRDGDRPDLLAASEPISNRTRHRLLERPEQDDDGEEHRRPQDAHLPVSLDTQGSSGNDVERIGEHARGEHRPRQEAGALETRPELVATRLDGTRLRPGIFVSDGLPGQGGHTGLAASGGGCV